MKDIITHDSYHLRGTCGSKESRRFGRGGGDGGVNRTLDRLATWHPRVHLQHALIVELLLVDVGPAHAQRRGRAAG